MTRRPGVKSAGPLALAALLAAAGCGHAASRAPRPAAASPAVSTSASAGATQRTTEAAAPASSDDAEEHRVRLSPLAARRLGIKTERVGEGAQNTDTHAPVARSTAPHSVAALPVSALTVVPLTALVFDPEGTAWTYVAADQDTFLRRPVVIDHIDGDLVYLRSGPGPGTPVVTVGAPELLGSEYGVGEE